MPRSPSVSASLALIAGLLAASSAIAQYKVVGPDGRVTFTDRAPTSGSATPATTGGENSNVLLPYELREAAGRYPVTLYTSAECQPCDAGRQLLRQRGIPYVERQAMRPAEDVATLTSRFGSGELPVLTIGSQIARGMAADTWNSYLDAAGYPRESKLPPNYRQPGPVALSTAPAPAPAPVRSAPPPVPQADPSGIKF